MSNTSGPIVGVGVFVFPHQTVISPGSDGKGYPRDKDHEQFVVGTRLGSHGAGTLALPGGHLEPTESFEACAAREVLEETGLTLDPDTICFLTATSSVMSGAMTKDGSTKHYVTIFMAGCVVPELITSEPKVLEPEKCQGWSWMSWATLKGLHLSVMGAGGIEAARKKRGWKVLFQPLHDLFGQREENGGFDPHEGMMGILEKKSAAAEESSNKRKKPS